MQRYANGYNRRQFHGVLRSQTPEEVCCGTCNLPAKNYSNTQADCTPQKKGSGEQAHHTKENADIMIDPMCIRELNLTDLNHALFRNFNRFQQVKKCWRQENGEWILKEIAFTENWDAANYRFLVKCLQATVTSGGTVFGALDQEKLIGFASLENCFTGSQKQYLQLSGIHVSCEYRGRGIGKKLFCRICERAARAGAVKLYISAHCAQETQAFYQALGCVDATEISADLAAREPCDRQLEYDLSRQIIPEPPAKNHMG